MGQGRVAVAIFWSESLLCLHCIDYCQNEGLISCSFPLRFVLHGIWTRKYQRPCRNQRRHARRYCSSHELWNPRHLHSHHQPHPPQLQMCPSLWLNAIDCSMWFLCGAYSAVDHLPHWNLLVSREKSFTAINRSSIIIISEQVPIWNFDYQEALSPTEK